MFKKNVVKYVLDNGGRFSIDSDFSLEWNNHSCHLDIVKYLCEKNLLSFLDLQKLLKWSCGNGHFDVLKFLYCIGVQDDKSDLLSCTTHNLEMSLFLILHGSPINVYEYNPMKTAALKGHLHTLELLVNLGSDVTSSDNFAVRFAAGKGLVQIVEYLYLKGADIRAGKDYAMWRATKNKDEKMIAFLRDKGF